MTLTPGHLPEEQRMIMREVAVTCHPRGGPEKARMKRSMPRLPSIGG
jgi:hypothetical protein